MSKHKFFVMVMALLCTFTSCTNSSTTPLTDIENLSTANPEEIVIEKSQTAHHDNWSSELIELMDTINEEHENVKKQEPDWLLYDYHFPNGLVDFSSMEMKKENYSEVLSQNQAVEDINTLWDILSERYALYYVYEQFDDAKKKLDKTVLTKELWTRDELRAEIIHELSFLEDCHFYIGNTAVSTVLAPYFYREVKYLKTDEGIFTIDNKEVVSVEGYEDFQHLFKRSLTIEGEIVYFPIVFGKRAVSKGTLYLEEPAPSPLVVHYNDGSTDILNAENFTFYQDKEEKEIAVKDDNDIPVIYARKMESVLFSATAKEINNESVSIIDLTRNGGGDAKYALQWWQNYCEETVPSNCYVFYNIDAKNTSPTIQLFFEIETIDGKTVGMQQQDQMVQNDNLTLILTGKPTASAAEWFVDLGHNVENTLFIGENTRGCLRSNLYVTEYLPNSGLEVRYGNALFVFPNGYFTECYGLEPDLWCPASEAEEAAINLIKKNIQLSE